MQSLAATAPGEGAYHLVQSGTKLGEDCLSKGRVGVQSIQIECLSRHELDSRQSITLVVLD